MRALPPLQPALQPGRLLRVLRGVGYVLQALAILARHRLWRLALVPAAATLVSFAALSAWTVRWAWPRAAALWAGAGAWEAAAPQVGSWPRLLAAVVAVPVAAGLAVVLALAAGQLLASPATALLSQRVEEIAAGRAPGRVGGAALLEAALTSVGDAAMSALYLPLANLALVALWLIPGLGGLTALGCAALLVAHLGLAPALARRGLSFAARWQVVRAHSDACLGLGGVLVACAWIPGLNLLVLPLAAAAGALMCADVLPEPGGEPAAEAGGSPPSGGRGDDLAERQR